jgi:hypothetical protein
MLVAIQEPEKYSSMGESTQMILIPMASIFGLIFLLSGILKIRSVVTE